MKHFLILSFSLIIIYSCISISSCSNDSTFKNYKTQNVFIIVVDGARYSETWGEVNHQNIPRRSSLLKQGVLCEHFFNNSFTNTCPGHEAICTGVYENINNTGLQYPTNPSIFQYGLKKFNHSEAEAWIITTKDKLEVLSDCENPDWKGTYRPNTDCGINGLFSGYREDSITIKHLKLIAATHPVKLAIINFKQPDAAGHAGDYAAYIQGIKDTDEYIGEFWNYLQSLPYYKDKTTLIVTNDHGRHSNDHLDGFVSHGDLCEGCKHVEFFAIGPDFKQNYICSTPYEQIDISSTVAELMGFKMSTSHGKIMKDIFQNKL